MKDRIKEAISKSKARYTEIRLEEKEFSEIALKGKEVEKISKKLDTGGIVRCLAKNGGWGIVSFNNLDELEKQVEVATKCAEAVSSEKVEIGEPEPVVLEKFAKLEEDFRPLSLKDKMDVLQEYNEIILSGKEVLTSSINYADRFVKYHFANSEGTYIYDEKPLIDLAIGAITSRNGDTQFDSKGDAFSNAGFEKVRNQQNFAQEALRNAQNLLDAKPMKGGNYEVVTDQLLSGVFVHEAFGHLSESDFIFDNPAAQKMMTLGRKFGTEILNIADSGTEKEILPGTHIYDDEGTPMQRTQLVKEGVLVGRLHSRETAQKMGEKPTGNARATDYRFPPIVRMRNTFVEPGNATREELISEIKDGLYAIGSFGGQTYLGDFSFSANFGYLIKNGKIQEMVKNIMLNGNIFETLSNVTGVGKDFVWHSGGRCGKGQGGLPVGMGAPSLRIKNVLIGGE